MQVKILMDEGLNHAEELESHNHAASLVSPLVGLGRLKNDASRSTSSTWNL
jgi:hypothetical protein